MTDWLLSVGKICLKCAATKSFINVKLQDINSGQSHQWQLCAILQVNHKKVTHISDSFVLYYSTTIKRSLTSVTALCYNTVQPQKGHSHQWQLCEILQYNHKKVTHISDSFVLYYSTTTKRPLTSVTALCYATVQPQKGRDFTENASRKG